MKAIALIVIEHLIKGKEYKISWRTIPFRKKKKRDKPLWNIHTHTNDKPHPIFHLHTSLESKKLRISNLFCKSLSICHHILIHSTIRKTNKLDNANSRKHFPMTTWQPSIFLSHNDRRFVNWWIWQGQGLHGNWQVELKSTNHNTLECGETRSPKTCFNLLIVLYSVGNQDLVYKDYSYKLRSLYKFVKLQLKQMSNAIVFLMQMTIKR